jgi:hypothetical protein
MNPCAGHRCDRCMRCRGGECCLGQRSSHEAELHARVLVTAEGQDRIAQPLDDCADALAGRVVSVLAGSLPTVEAGLVAGRKP